MKKTSSFLIFVLAVILLAGCASTQKDAAKDAAGSAVENYFQAIVSGDASRIATVSCPAWEETARGEVASFAGVKARLNQVSCKSTTTQQDQATVECTGNIIATYNNEDQTFELQGRTFNVVRQNGEWLVCGYGK